MSSYSALEVISAGNTFVATEHSLRLKSISRSVVQLIGLVMVGVVPAKYEVNLILRKY